MDWDVAIKRNSEALVEIVADLFTMLGLVALTDTVSRLPWPTYRGVLRILRPAESALRRLIVIAARGLLVAPVVSRPRRVGGIRKKGRISHHSFQLFDPRTASFCRAGEFPSGPARVSTCSTPTTNW